MARLDQQVARRIHKTVSALATDPRPSGCKALTGHPGLLRVRVGDWRVVYTVKDDQVLVLVLRVGHRGTIYRDLH